jgi:hypothetical protein
VNNSDPTGLWCIFGHNPNGGCRGSATVVNAWHDTDHAWDCLTSACYASRTGAANAVAGAHNTLNYVSGLPPVPIPYPCSNPDAYALGGQLPYVGAFAVPGLGELDLGGLAAGSDGAADSELATVDTPYGPAVQDSTAAAIAARADILSGATLYRFGTTLQSEATEAQFWALESPTTPGYASLYGLPEENITNADFLETAVLRPGTPFVTRAAPGIGTNIGGGIEIVVPSGGVISTGFSYLGPKGLTP